MATLLQPQCACIRRIANRSLLDPGANERLGASEKRLKMKLFECHVLYFPQKVYRIAKQACFKTLAQTMSKHDLMVGDHRR